MPPQKDLSDHERYGDINRLIAYLQSIERDGHILCIYEDDSACGFKMTAHKKHSHKNLFKEAGATLSKNYEFVEKSEFISVLRIFFCSIHDPGNRSKEWKNHMIHLAKFWNNDEGERKLRRKLWKALGECHARINDYNLTTPQKGRLDRNRGFSSVPRDISRPAERRRSKAELTENARASTVQGNPGREVSLRGFGAEKTPSKPPRVSNRPRNKATTNIKRENSDDESHCERSSDEECSNGRRSSKEPSDQEPSDYGTDADDSCDGNTCDSGGTTTGGGLLGGGGLFGSGGLFGGGNTSGGFGTNATSGGFGSATTGPKHSTKPVEVNHVSRGIPYRFVGTSQASFEVTDGQPAPFANGPDASESCDDGSSPSKRVHPEASGIKLFSPAIQRSLFTFSKPITPARESAPLFQAGYGGSPHPHTSSSEDELAKLFRLYKERTEGVSAYQENSNDAHNSTTSPENAPVPLTQTHVPESTLFTHRTPITSRDKSRELTPFSNIQSRGTLFQAPLAAPLSTFTSPPHPETPPSQRAIPPPITPITPSPQLVHDSSPLTPAQYTSQDIVAQVRKLLKKDLTSSMYILSAPSFFSTTFTPTRATGETWVKIGFSGDVRERVKEISSKCGIPNLRAVYQSQHRIRTDVLRVIEAVCHEQLINFKRTMDCGKYGLSEKCTQVHREWFAVPTEVAKRTVEMWEGFARRYPYAQDGELKTPWARSLKGFTLREQWEEEEDEKDEEAEEEDMLHESFQAWITTTGLARGSSRDVD